MMLGAGVLLLLNDVLATTLLKAVWLLHTFISPAIGLGFATATLMYELWGHKKM